MYKVTITTSGKYSSWTLGDRYILGKRNAEKFIADALEYDCGIIVKKLVYIGDGMFVWSDDHALYGGVWYRGEEE